MLLELQRGFPNGWTLIGAQMVALFAAEHRRTQPRYRRDADILVNVRMLHNGIERLSRTLVDLGFGLTDVSPEGLGHRFADSRGVQVDLLAPEGVGPRTRLLTVPPARTVLVPAGTPAIARTETVDVQLDTNAGTLPRPNLRGAILLKCRAVDIDDAPDNQRLDLVFFLSVVEDPRVMASSLKATERSWLRRRTELLDDPNAPAWRSLGLSSEAETAYLTLRILSDR